MQTESSGEQGLGTALKRLVLGFFRDLGALRTPLLLLAVVAIVLAPGGDTRVQYEGWAFAHTVLLPTVAPLLLAGLLLDSLMSRVLMDGAGDDRRRQLRVVIRTELVMAVVLVVSYLPFLLSIFT
ncbi:MAG: hypothetical protein JJT90_10330 [Ectothiorhodospiraceae bacterium]|nr:hypothetical protein [Ectothiorhodospiraceae bacterium]